ncbi:MAG: ATP-binding cassette domain-containing protein, partial [bacterium]|nr:ATP-binding cassette domain-containing protein [bacterium]
MFGDAVLQVRDLSVPGDRGLEAVRNVSFDVRGGEVIGVAGVSGNGQRELAYGLVGLRAPTAGTVMLDDHDVTATSVEDHIDKGIAYVPQSRLGMGLAPGLTTEDNLGLKEYRRPPFSNGPWLRAAAFKEHSAALIEKYDIRGVRPGLPIRLLSGGNLQKALIAREVTLEPKVLIARSPTRGL